MRVERSIMVPASDSTSEDYPNAVYMAQKEIRVLESQGWAYHYPSLTVTVETPGSDVEVSFVIYTPDDPATPNLRATRLGLERQP